MRRFFLRLFCLGAILAFFTSQLLTPGSSAAQPTTSSELLRGTFNSIVVDFNETEQVLSHLPDSLSVLNQSFGLSPVFNSAFSQADHIYILSGDRENSLTDNLALLDRLRQSSLASQAEYIEPNYIYSQSGFQVNDPDYDKQWNLKQINAEAAWGKGANGRGVTVAVIDTGISQGPDLKQTDFVPGYDFVNDREIATDDNGHGTHVAGTIAQSTNNGYGVAGIAYGAKLMPLKVLSRGGSGTIADIAEAIRFAADHKADVINMSLGGGGDSKLMREAIEYAHSKGVVIVAAAGNSGLNSASYPALYPNVIAVSAIGPDEKKTSYSNYGTGVDIAAPGGVTRQGPLNGVLQETINPRVSGEFQFKAFQGTSMAAPHVAGVAALVKSRSRSLSADRVWEILKTSARPVADDSQNYYGAGYLDADKAVKMTRPCWWDWSQFDIKDIGLKLFVAACFVWLLAPRSQSFNPWKLTFLLGIFSGSVGLFVLRALHLSILPDWPLQWLGTAIPEWTATNALNPIFAGGLIPFILMMFFISQRSLRWLSLGVAIGMIAFMTVTLFSAPEIWLVGSGQTAQIYLLVNVVLGSIVTRLFFNVAVEDG